MQFRTRPEGFRMIRKWIIIMTVVIVGVAFGLVAVSGLFSDNSASRETSLLTILTSVLIIAFTTMGSLKRNREQFLNFVLTIDQNVVTAETPGLTTVTIRHSDIVSIVKAKSGGIVITGINKADKIAIPAEMQNYDRMAEMLKNLKPITEGRRDYTLLSWLLTLAGIGLVAANIVIKDRIINIISCGFTVVLLGWGFVRIQRDPRYDRWQKAGSWVILIPLLTFAYLFYVLIR